MKSIKIFIRGLMRQKSVSVLAIGSLSVGMAVALLIGLWVFEEFSFDCFHKNGDHIYRLITENRDLSKGSNTFRQMGDNMKDGFPEVQGICLISGAGSEYEVDKVIYQDIQTIQAGDNFFSFFSFPLKTGDAANCLDAPGKMVISESVARKWFPGKNPMGQAVKANGVDWQITGVMQNIPYNSHIQADVVVHFYGRNASPDCGGDMFSTYLYAPVIPDMQELEQKLTRLSDETNSLMKELGITCKLQLLRDIHFSGVRSDHPGNKSLVIILVIAALGILLIAIVNFVNLFVATSFLRVREIGVRKTFGADRKKLIWAFYRETLGFVGVAFVVGVLLAVLFLPLFNRLIDCQLKFGFDSPVLYLYLVGIIVFTFLASGTYPAFYMTRFGVSDTLGGQFRGKKLSFLQNSLLVLQFTISIAFLILIFFVHKQVNYMVNYDLGFDKENVVCISLRPDMYKHYDAMRDELMKNPTIKDVTLRDGVPMEWADGYPVQKPGSEERIQFEVCQVKPNLFDLLGIKLIAGENPFRDTQENAYLVLDELAVERLGLQEPLGAELRIWGMRFIVKGVVRSTKNKSLKEQESYPVAYMPVFQQMVHLGHFYLMCKVSGNPQGAIGDMRTQWERYAPGIPFDYKFLDDAYQKLYDSEIRLGKIFLCAMVVMLLLSTCGLFAIAYYKMQRQLKEVGVRKVNGASILDLLVLLNMGFVRLVLLAFIIAGGISYYFSSLWLESFAVRTSLSWWVFAGAGFIAVAVALFTVSFLTLRAARMNPVEALKSE